MCSEGNGPHIKISMEDMELVHHSSILHMTIMYLWWYHVTNCTGYHRMGAWFICGSVGRL